MSASPGELPAWLREADLSPWTEQRFARSSGPGGQHVNKLSTRVELLFDYLICPLVPHHLKDLVTSRLANRLSRDGRLRVVVQEDRSQSANREKAESRLRELLARATHLQAPRTATRPTAGSKRRRLKAKRERGEVKRQRRGRIDSAD
jgi:ribosome-associated protein